MQSVLPRTWTRVAMSISYNDNHYTTGSSRWLCGNINKTVYHKGMQQSDEKVYKILHDWVRKAIHW